MGKDAAQAYLADGAKCGAGAIGKASEKAKPRPNLGLTWLEAALNFEDRVEVVALGEDGALWHSWQIDVPPFWSQWESLGAPPVQIREPDRLTIGTNQDRRLEVFVADKNGAVWHTWEIR